MSMIDQSNVEEALDIEDIAEHLYATVLSRRATTTLLRSIRNRMSKVDDEAFKTLYNQAIREERDALLSLLKVGIALPDGERKNELLELVKETSFEENMRVMHLVNHNESPGRWSGEVEEEVRDAINRAFEHARMDIPDDDYMREGT